MAYRNREPRQRVDIPCELAGIGTVREGRVRDLSPFGCRLLSAHLGSEGERLLISLAVPGSLREVPLLAEARWSEMAPTRNLYLMGCRFVHSEQTEKTLRTLVEGIETNRLPRLRRKPGDDTRRFRKSLSGLPGRAFEKAGPSLRKDSPPPLTPPGAKERRTIQEPSRKPREDRRV